jgi:hypothetical protein
MSAPPKVNHNKELDRLIAAICQEIVDTIRDELSGKASLPTQIANIFRITIGVQGAIGRRIIEGVDKAAMDAGAQLGELGQKETSTPDAAPAKQDTDKTQGRIV